MNLDVDGISEEILWRATSKISESTGELAQRQPRRRWLLHRRWGKIRHAL